jgi:prepilin-type N-terminal cleavage/methylation domain-containing protein
MAQKHPSAFAAKPRGRKAFTLRPQPRERLAFTWPKIAGPTSDPPKDGFASPSCSARRAGSVGNCCLPRRSWAKAGRLTSLRARFRLVELTGRRVGPTLRPVCRTGRKREPEAGFTLIELLIVIAIIIVLMALLAPAFTNLKSAGDVTSAAYTIKGVLDSARTYAMANNTYTWVGFYEENVSTASKNPANPGVGRVVMSIVASTDGTMIYTAPLTTLVTLAPAKLVQVGKLAKIENLHLKNFPAPTASPPPDTFDTRPAVSSTSAQIGDTTPPSPSLRFQYPLGGTAQYTFTKAIQFSPRGEGVIDNSNYTLTTVSEIGVQLTHGITPEPSPVKNPVAIQFTGVGGNVKIYRR